MDGFWLRSAGYLLESVAPAGAIGEIVTTWERGEQGGGLGRVEWVMDLPYDFDHPALRRGALVEVMDGAQRVGQAILAEPGRTDTGRSFSALGIYRIAERYVCLDADGVTTTIPDEAVDQAAVRGAAHGAPFLTRAGELSDNPLVTDSVTDGLNRLDVLLTNLAIETSKRWWVDADARIHLDADATEPDLYLLPGLVDPAPADENYAPMLFGRYIFGSTRATAAAFDQAASDRWGYREYGIDMGELGSISEARANNRLAGLLARGKSRLTLADRITVSRYELLTRGAQPASLAMVRDGQVVRVPGLAAYSQWLNGKPWLDFVIGEAVWPNGAEDITLAPINLAATSFEELLADTGPARLNP